MVQEKSRAVRQWVSVLYPVLLSLGLPRFLPSRVTAIAQRRGESVSGQLCRWCPRCPPPVNIHNVFSDIFRTRRNFYTGSAQPPTTELPFGTPKLSKNWSRFSFSVCVVTYGNFKTTASVDFAWFAWHNASAMWHAAGFACRNRVVKLFDETSYPFDGRRYPIECIFGPRWKYYRKRPP